MDTKRLAYNIAKARILLAKEDIEGAQMLLD